MAIVKSLFQMSGSVGGYTFYPQKGTGNLIMRTKGGLTKEKMANLPKYEKIRRNQREFSGCAKFGSKCRMAFGELSRVASYNINSSLVAIGKSLMKMDTTLETGERSLKLSLNKQVMEEFDFNKAPRFSSMMYRTLPCELSRENLQGVVYFPMIDTRSVIKNIHKLPFFRFIIAIGTVSDMVYNPETEKYEPMEFELNGASVTVTGEWFSTHTVLPESTMTVQMHESRKAFLTDNITVLLSVGLEFGNSGYDNQNVTVYKNSGSGMVLACR